MMRVWIYILLVFIYSCNNKKNELISTLKRESIQKNQLDNIQINQFKKLIKLYKEIKFDTLKVISESKKYEGRDIPRTLAVLFSKDLEPSKNKNISWYYACYKFKIDNVKIGLITRTPSEYASTSIKIFVLDTVKNKIENSFELAESWGDAGASWIVDSWLIKQKNILIYRQILETWDHNADDSSYNQIDSKYYYHLIQLKNNRFDTLAISKLKLEKTFKKLNNKK